MCLRLLVFVSLALIWTSSVVPAPASPSPPPTSYFPELSLLDPEFIKIQQKHFRENPNRNIQTVSFHLRAKQETYLLRAKDTIATVDSKVQIWKGIPEFLARSITTLSHKPIPIPGSLTPKEVTLVVTAYVIPPNHVRDPREVQFVSLVTELEASPDSKSDKPDPQVQEFMEMIEALPVLHVAPIEPAPPWGKGTAVWAHILRSLGAVAQDSLHQVTTTHFQLIIGIAWANPDFSEKLYYKFDFTNNMPLGFILLGPDEKPTPYMKKVIKHYGDVDSPTPSSGRWPNRWAKKN